MASTWSAGERADAHQVVGVLREKFARHEKKASREFVADYFRAVGATSVLDLWGGGASADALRAAMPDARIVSVENGDVCDKGWFSDRLGRKITKARLRRAHLIAAEEGGYEAAWGDAAKALAEPFDAVWLDFCAQWHPAMAKIIRLAGERTNHLAVSVMPERDGLGSLGLEDRLVGLTAILAGHADMVPAYVGSYRRNELGQDMALFVLDRRGGSGDGHEVAAIYPNLVRSGLARRGSWSSRRLSGRSSLILMKCARCDDSFTYRPTSLGSTGIKYCPAHRAPSNYVAGIGRVQRARQTVEGRCGRCGSIFGGPPGKRWCSRSCAKAARETRRRGQRAVRLPQQAVCHPERRHQAKGLCSPCYEFRRYRAAHDSWAQCANPECEELFERVQSGQRKFCSQVCRRKAKGGAAGNQGYQPRPPRAIVCGACGQLFVQTGRGRSRKRCASCSPPQPRYTELRAA